MRKIKWGGIFDNLAVLILLVLIILSIFSRPKNGIYSWQFYVSVATTLLLYSYVRYISPWIKRKTGERTFNSVSEIIQCYRPKWYKKCLKFKRRLQKLEEG